MKYRTRCATCTHSPADCGETVDECGHCDGHEKMTDDEKESEVNHEAH